MRISPILFLASSLMGGPGWAGSDTPKPSPQQLFDMKCAPCHTVPDRKFFADRSWLDQIRVTAWGGTKTGAREALIHHFARSPVNPPAVVDSSGASPGSGEVRSTVDEGEVFLVSERSQVYRLTWKASDADRRRHLPAGKYKVRGYRIFRRDPAGDLWHISVSSPGFRDMLVSESHPVTLKIDPTVFVGSALKRNRVGRGHWAFSTIVYGERKQGLAMYRNGKRIGLGFRLFDAEGKTTRTGSMEYG